MGGSAPAPPSMSQGMDQANTLAGGQWNYNEGAQAGSNYNESNPYGSLTRIQTGTGPNGAPIYTNLSQFSPEQAPLWAQSLMSKGIAGGQGTSLLSGANYGAEKPSDVIGNNANGITGQIINGQVDYLKPYQQWETANLDTKLKNQGNLPGSPAYDMAMKRMQDNHNLSIGNMIGQATPQAYGIATNQYTLPASMAMALGGYGAPMNPNSLNSGGAALQPANLQGAFSSAMDALNTQYKAQLAQYQADAKNQSDMIGTGIKLGSMFI